MLSRCFILDPKILVRFIASDAAKPLLDDLAGIVGLREVLDKETLRIHLISSGECLNTGEGALLRDEKAVLSIRNELKIRFLKGRGGAVFELENIGRESSDASDFRIRTVSTILGASFLLLLGEAVLLHGALLVRDGTAVVLIGPSGAGKSTSAARVPPPWRPISDDLAAAVIRPDKSVCVHGLPTWSRLYSGQEKDSLREHVDINEGYYLKKVFFLEKAERDEARCLSNSEGVAKIVQSSLQLYSGLWRRFSPEDKIAYKGRLLAGAKRILDRVECSILRVSLNGPFWNLME